MLGIRLGLRLVGSGSWLRLRLLLGLASPFAMVAWNFSSTSSSSSFCCFCVDLIVRMFLCWCSAAVIRVDRQRMEWSHYVCVIICLHRALLDTLLDSMDTSSAGLQPVPTAMMDVVLLERGREEVPSSSQTARILNLFAFLMNQAQAAVKAAVLYLPQTGYDQLRCFVTKLW